MLVMSNDKTKLIWLLAMLCIWILFLFWDAYFGNVSKNMWTENTVKDNTLEQDNGVNYSYSDMRQDSHWSPTIENQNNGVKKQIEESMQQHEIDLWFSSENIVLQDTGFNSYTDIESLQKIYETNPSTDLLNLLISKLIKWYQFDLARNYLSTIDIFEHPDVSIKDYIYVYINTLSVTDSTSIYKFDSFIDEAKQRSFISNDDYIFYKWLVDLWKWQYNQAMTWLSLIADSFYSQFVSQLSGTISNYSIQQWAPSYYEDALIAMVCLKNWYFALANKLAVQALLQNWDYILPYQVLSYSNFLTQNREKAIDYFYKLGSLDTENYEKYNFYIWISYYRYGNYEKSIAALVPLLNTSYKDDAYRYLLLDYEKIWDQNKMIQIWQKQLWTTKLKASDFRYFFDKVFFIPFSNGENFKIYKEYKQMAYDFVTQCYEKLWDQNDTCIYGNVWLDIANSNRNSAIDNLIYLSKNYPQASIFQALWNYYKIVWDNTKAKNYFLKAVSMSENTVQKNLIENILINLNF